MAWQWLQTVENAGSTTLSVTLAAGTNRKIYFILSWEYGGNSTITSIDFGGATPILISDGNNSADVPDTNNNTATGYYFDIPDAWSGVKVLTLAFANTVVKNVNIAVTYSGLALGNADVVQTYQSAGASINSNTLNITPVSGVGLIISGAGTSSNVTFTAGPGETLRGNSLSGGSGGCGTEKGHTDNSANSTTQTSGINGRYQQWNSAWSEFAAGGGGLDVNINLQLEDSITSAAIGEVSTAPVYTPNSFVKSVADTNAVHTLSLPVSALANRRWIIFNLAKDNIAVPTPVTGITFNGNSIGSGIIEIGSRQIAIEGSFSSQAQAWIVKDADGPTIAGNYNVVITSPQAAQGTHYCAFEISGSNQSDVMDAIALFSSIVDISAGASYSHSITTNGIDRLIIDAWSQSNSTTPIITPIIPQNQIGVNMVNSSGGANVSWLNKVSAGSQVVGQTTDSLSQRQAGITFSIGPVNGAVGLNVTLAPNVADSVTSAQAGLEGSILGALNLQDSVTSMAVSETGAVSVNVQLDNSVTAVGIDQQEDATIAVQLQDSVTNISIAETEAVTINVQLDNSATSMSVDQQEDVTIAVNLQDSITEMVASESGSVFVSVQLENSVSSFAVGQQSGIRLNTLLQDSVTNIAVSEKEAVSINVQLDNSVSAFVLSEEKEVSIATLLGDSITVMNASVGNASVNVGINIQLDSAVANINLQREANATIGITLQDSQTLINVSGISVPYGSFRKMVSGHSVHTKEVHGGSKFMKDITAEYEEIIWAKAA